MNQLERIKNELNIAGYRLEPVTNEVYNDDDYVQSIGNAVWEVCKKFSEQDFSGLSANLAINMLKRLLDGKTLTPLTNRPEEWEYHEYGDKKCWQSNRDFSCFSDDLKEYYDIDEEENREWELDENGEKTGWSCVKPFKECIKRPLNIVEVK